MRMMPGHLRTCSTMNAAMSSAILSAFLAVSSRLSKSFRSVSGSSRRAFARFTTADQPPERRRTTTGRTVEVTYRRLADGRVLTIHRDITAIFEHEEQLRAAQAETERARAIAEAAQDMLDDALGSMTGGVGIWGPDEKLIQCNAAYRAVNSNIPDIVTPGTTLEVAADAAMRAQYTMMGLDRKSVV